MSELTLEDMDNLRHMLGADAHTPYRDWGYRNHYAPSKSDVPSMERLRDAGLTFRGRPYEDVHFYHATEKGCKFIGLNAKQTKRALEP